MRIAAAWSWRLLLVAAVIGVALFLIVQLRFVVVPAGIALILGALLGPFSAWLQRHKWPRWAAIVLAGVGLIGVVGGLVTISVFQVRSEWPDVVDQTLVRWDEFLTWLVDGLPFGLNADDINSYVDAAIVTIQQDLQGLFTGALEIGSSIGHVIAGALITLFVTVFILIDGRGMWRGVLRLFPARARAAVDGAAGAGWTTLSLFVRAQIFVAFVDAVGIGIGAWILGLVFGGFPLVLPIAVAVFLASFIPIIGAVATGAVAAFIALVFLGPVPALIMVGIVILVQQLEGHVLQPFVMGSAVKVHPVAVVLAVASGGYLAGIAGAFFAVPLVAATNTMVGYIARGGWHTTISAAATNGTDDVTPADAEKETATDD
jgi:predicted PurR-regulated permease PerM